MKLQVIKDTIKSTIIIVSGIGIPVAYHTQKEKGKRTR
jgi:hypothetical protein